MASTTKLSAHDAALESVYHATRPHPERDGNRSLVPMDEFCGEGAPSFLTPEEVRQFAELGYCVIRGRFQDGEIARVREALDRIEEKTVRRTQFVSRWPLRARPLTVCRASRGRRRPPRLPRAHCARRCAC